MKTHVRVCVKPFEITAENGDHFELKVGKEYTTSRDWEDGTCTVFSKYWVRVPTDRFEGVVEPNKQA